jgi:deoxyribonuclease V
MADGQSDRETALIACVDVHYRDPCATAAALFFERWDAATASAVRVLELSDVAPYEPGHFFRRELPCLSAVLDRPPATLQAVIVDGYVWLGPERGGLGFHLFEALGRQVPVVGVAKTRFANDGTTAVPVLRGKSERPLFVTSVGIPVVEAAERILAMHGSFRIPTLLKEVDGIARQSEYAAAVPRAG